MIREYDSKRQQIPNEIITNLIRNAHRAPSAGQVEDILSEYHDGLAAYENIQSLNGVNNKITKSPGT